MEIVYVIYKLRENPCGIRLFGVNSEKSKLFTKTKNLKNISKTFQKPIDILIFMCYNIITVRGTPQERKR